MLRLRATIISTVLEYLFKLMSPSKDSPNVAVVLETSTVGDWTLINGTKRGRKSLSKTANSLGLVGKSDNKSAVQYSPKII